MAYNEPQMFMSGNLADDPEMRFTPNGSAVAAFRIIATPRYRDSQSGEWVDGDPYSVRCNAWRDMAENICESFRRGDRLVVYGRLRTRTYTDREDNQRYSTELEVDDVGASVRFREVNIKRVKRDKKSGDNDSDESGENGDSKNTSRSQRRGSNKTRS